MSSKIAGAMANLSLVLASCLAGLLLCEAGLRLFYPKYKHLAEAVFIRDPNLLSIRLPNHRGFVKHPDTGAPHTVFHNNHGLRQHRNFSAADLESSVSIGFFGDSFTENTRIKAQFSFTEPLDYLLNTRGGINVLNFGVDSYGTSQSLLRYEMLDFQEALDHVFYVCHGNDLMGNLEDGLFRLDDAGRLVREEAYPARFTSLSKLHLPYLVLDAGGRLSAHLEDLKAEVRQLRGESNQRMMAYKAQGLRGSALLLFRQMLRRWKEAAESNGASFRLVWLPIENPNASRVAAIAEAEGIETVNLRDCFGERDPAHLHTPWELSPYRLENDGHWNEAANRLAAVCLHRVLEGALGMPPLSEEEVALALRRYYAAFGAPASVFSRGARRDAPRMKTEDWSASPQAEAIRRKYAALELDEAPSPAERAPGARFDLYLRDGRLAYVKEDCTWTDFQDRFFLHVYPADARDLPAHRRKHGFDNLDFFPNFNETTCTTERRLPSYAIDRIRTGQFYKDGDGGYNTLWEAELPVRMDA